MHAYLNNAITVCNQALWDGADVTTACQTLGNVLQAIGRFEEAMDWHTRSIQSQPNRAELFASLGKLYAQQHQWTEAIAAYQQTLSLQPNHAGAYWSLANIYAQLGNASEEVACRQQALTLNPDWATPQHYLSMGNVLMAQNQLDEASTFYRRALQVQPKFLEAQYNLAVVLSKQGYVAEAIAAFQTALTYAPNHSESHFGLGKTLEQQGQWREAIACYRNALESKPDFASALHALGELLLTHGNWDEGISIYRRVVALNPEFSWSYHYLGYALLKQGQEQEAVTILQEAIQRNPSFPWTHYHLAVGFSRLRLWDQAIAAILAAIQLQFDLVEVYPLLGRALHKRLQQDLDQQDLDQQDSNQQNSNTLLDRYQQAPPLALQNRTREFYYRLGQALFKHQQLDGAEFFYRLAQKTGTNPAVLVNTALTNVRAAKQQLHQTIATHRQQIKRHPQLPWAYSQLANVLAEQGDLEEAIVLNRRANVLHGWHQAKEHNYEFTRDWFTHHIPVWKRYLIPLAHTPGLQILEVGSFEGRSTCWFLDHLLTEPNSHMTCIDLYFQDQFDLNLDRTGAIDKVTKMRGNSVDILPTLPPNTYDIIYIDGCHLADHVRQDAFLSWSLLKPGGILIFDDYEFHDPAHPGQDSKPAIDQFLDAVHSAITILHKEYQVILQKVS